MRLVLSLVAFLVLYGCIMGEAVLKVKGQLVNQKREVLQNCVLELHSPEIPRILDKRLVSGLFNTSFLIDPKPKKYYFIIHCPEVVGMYISAAFVGTSYGEVPLDLGEITLGN